ncbi:hypothetical protein lerEdw1_003318 [Lerista edwardsae]|nr:hypothetical protein lerEdw1_003318 [Lerista edwardsae]
MAEKEMYLHPVLVEGDWGPSVSKSLKNKLLCYFQSPKRSGGGECKILMNKEKQIAVYFADEKVRQRVLGLKTHELDMSGRKKLKLSVSLPLATDENSSLGESHSTQESIVAKEPQEPVNQQVPEPKPINHDVPVKRKPKLPKSDTSAEKVCNKDQASSMESASQEKGCPENVAGEMMIQQEFCILVESAAGGELDEEIVALYFENTKRSGGGPVQSCVRDGQQLIITFENKEDAQEVLQRKNHSVNKMELCVRQCQLQAARDQPQMSTSLVLLENVHEKIDHCMLILLIENVSGLSEDDCDFSVEMIPEKDAAVITLVKPTEIDKFVEAFNQHHRVQQLNISACPLEETKTILVENLPSGIAQDYIAVYFESKKHGGGPVLDISCLPEENSAIVTFRNGKDVITVLAQNHTFSNVPLVVSPYYTSLGSALYGKQRPQIKMPDPVKVPLDPYYWQFFQQNPKLLHNMSNEMANCFCEMEWATRDPAHPEIIMHPSRALRKQKRSLVRTWKEDVSIRFAQVLSKWKVVKCDVNAEVWEAIRNSVVKGDVLILPDIPKEIVALVGAADATDQAAQEMKLLVENAAKKIEREKQTIEENVSVSAGKFTILNNAGLQNTISLECPNLNMAFNASKELVTLRGVASEVFKIKSNILERIAGMVQKRVNVHPNIHFFLNHVDNETLSQLLFWVKNINALYELTQEGVLLTAVVFRDLVEAEEVLKKDLAYKCIELEDNSVIKKREWRELVDSLYKACNCSSETIIIDEQKDQVVIAGYFEEVARSHAKLSDFVDNNTCIKKTVRTKSTAVTEYVEKEKRNSWLHLRQQGVEICFGTQTRGKVISLEGPRKEVLKGVELIQNILSSLWATSVIVDKPGAKAFFREQEHLYVAGAMQQFNCLIRIQEGTDEDGELESEVGNVPEEMGLPRCEVKLQNDIVVEVHKGDLTRCQVDVVVNASNEELKHIGGLADALLKVAGPQLQRECDDLVRKHGKVKPGCAIITSAWNLPCKQVIHAVGPRWRSSEKEKCTLLLKKVVKECLKLAETYNHSSVAIPAVSSGVFGFPLKECAHSIVTSIKETLAEYTETGSLKKICLVDFKEETVQELSDALTKVCKESVSPSKWSSSPQVDNRSRGTRPEDERITTPEGLKIILQKKGIEDSTTDAVVNSIVGDLELGRGPLSKALLGKAGAELQEELTEQGKGKDIKEGCVLKTGGYALGCSHVLHAVLPVWDQGQTSEKILGEIIEKCLKMTEQDSLNSITFPAVGTGNLRFPKPLVAKLMFDEVFKFSQTNPRNLQEVHFVLHPRDIDAIKAFTNELKKRLNHTSSSASMLPESSQQAFFGCISTSPSGTHKMQLGSIALQVECGDITQETTDAIVNISNDTFTLKVGVSKAILDRAGPKMETECAQLASQPHNRIICTRGGNLKCKNVIHLVAQVDTKQQVSKTLLECEQRLFTSVAFPAIGTGQAGRDPAVVADDMIDAIVDFASSTPAPVVKCIKIVIFQPHLQAVFYTAMQKKANFLQKLEASTSSPQSSKSFFSKIADFFTFKKPAEESKPTVGLKPELLLEMTVEPTIFQICGDSQMNVEKTESWIKTLIVKNQDEIAIADEWISELGESEYEKMRELQKKLYVVIKVESTGSLRILGITKDVLSASIEIQKMLRKIRNAHEEQSKADLCSNIVEWRYEDNGRYRPFSKQENMHIEFAAQQQRLHEVTIENKRYTVDPSKFHATDNQGNSIALRRISKAEVNQVLPEEWEDMEQQLVKVVKLNPEMMEYQKVKQKFCQTCQSFKIEKIERIQNPYKWQAYQIKKQEMDAKNGNNNNEKLLFHGTSSTTLDLINTSGFNRSYAGMNAAMYGNGTYFAVDAKYSASDGYSKPDANGQKYMYLARVLVGEYCAGEAGLVVPRAKQGTDPTNLFDSVTDKVQAPSMFVIFNDIQAYPEYLITFKK